MWCIFKICDKEKVHGEQELFHRLVLVAVVPTPEMRDTFVKHAGFKCACKLISSEALGVIASEFKTAYASL